MGRWLVRLIGLLGFGLLLAQSAGAQGTAPGCPPTHGLPPADEAEVRRLAEDVLVAYHTAHIVGWNIVEISGMGEWGIVAIAPIAERGESLPGDGDILLARREAAGWRVLWPGDPEFRDWLAAVPAELLIPFPERGRFVLSPGPGAPSQGWYRLPYACGATAYVSRAGGDHNNAIDFLIDGVTGGLDAVVAAQAGWVYRIVQDRTACCCSPGYASNTLVLRHANGEYSYYLHLTPGSVTVQVGEFVAQGQVIAREGDVGYTCSSSGGLCRTRFCDVPGDLDYCCEHLHFEVRDNGDWQGAPLEPQFADVEGAFVQTGRSYVSGNCGGDTTPPETTASLAGIPGEGGWYLSPVTVTLSAQDNPGGCGVRATYWQMDGRAYLTYTAPFTIDGEGEHTLAYYSVDHCGNAETPSAPTVLALDLYDPFNPVVLDPGCAALNNGWQGACADAAFSWSGARDSRSGVRDYLLYWGTDPLGQPASVFTATAFDPDPIPEGQPYFLRLATRDLAGRQGLSSTLYVLRYDATAPTFSALAIDGGSPIAHQVTVRLDLTAADNASGLSEMRFSNDGLEWSPWQPFSPQAAWALPARDHSVLAVTAQVRDRAGNWAEASDDIYLDLQLPPPHAPDLLLCASVVDTAGGARMASANFRLVGALGQMAAGGAAGSSGTDLSLWSGFLAEIESCRPISGTTLAGWSGSHSVPTSWPTSRPERFGLQVNGGYTFTNQARVTLTLWGPDTTQMQVSNQRTFAGALWQPYRLERPWTIDTTGRYGAPCLVYARFRDTAGVIYGDYVDDIYYDPVPPWGRAAVVAQGVTTMTLWLEAWDDLSGVGTMRLAEEEAGLPLVPWETYTPTVVVPRTAAMYVQFRDRAGNVSTPALAGGYRLYLPLVENNSGQ